MSCIGLHASAVFNRNCKTTSHICFEATKAAEIALSSSSWCLHNGCFRVRELSNTIAYVMLNKNNSIAMV